MKTVLKYIGMKDINLETYGLKSSHKIYCEPFSGSFNTGLKLHEQGHINRLIYNDIDERVVNFWIQLRDNEDELLNNIENTYNKIEGMTDKEKEETLQKLSNSINSIDRATSEFIYREYLNMSGNNWQKRRPNIDKFDFYLCSEAFKDIDINNEDYSLILQRYDSEDTFFLIDPPYDISRVNTYYRGDYRRFNHDKLAECIKQLKGDWLLTYNDNQHIRELYKDCNIQEVHREIYGRTYVELYITKKGK